jgi:hypothetical protein
LLAEYADADQAWLLLEAWLNWLEIFWEGWWCHKVATRRCSPSLLCTLTWMWQGWLVAWCQVFSNAYWHAISWRVVNWWFVTSTSSWLPTIIKRGNVQYFFATFLLSFPCPKENAILQRLHRFLLFTILHKEMTFLRWHFSDIMMLVIIREYA